MHTIIAFPIMTLTIPTSNKLISGAQGPGCPSDGCGIYCKYVPSRDFFPSSNQWLGFGTIAGAPNTLNVLRGLNQCKQWDSADLGVK